MFEVSLLDIKGDELTKVVVNTMEEAQNFEKFLNFVKGKTHTNVVITKIGEYQ